MVGFMKALYDSISIDVYDCLKESVKYLKLNGMNAKHKDCEKAKSLAQVLPSVLSFFENGQTFRLPDNGCLFDEYKESNQKRLNKFVKSIRLPYPICILEFDAFIDKEMAEQKGLEQVNTYRYCLMLVEQEDYISVYEFIDDGNHRGISIVSADSLRLDTRTFNFYDNEKAYGFSDTVINREKTIIDFICALSCKNVEIRDSDIKPSKVKQMIRKNKGKIPLFTHKILSLNDKPMGESKASKGGTHASPSMHLRRGHIRNLKDRHIWVNSCVVGKEKDGVVVKSYSLETA